MKKTRLKFLTVAIQPLGGEASLQQTSLMVPKDGRDKIKVPDSGKPAELNNSKEGDGKRKSSRKMNTSTTRRKQIS